MKRIILLMMLCLCVLTGCGKNKECQVDDVVKYIEELKSYSLTSTMTINKENKTISMDIAVDYLAPNYYKVVFGKDEEQIILKNDKGVYVLTPNLNKEFKFDGSWPTNSSHAYLLDSICKDLKTDANSKITNSENTIMLEGKVNHKTNQKITKMQYVCDKNYKPIKTTFLDDNNNELVIVEFKTFIANSTLSKDHFNQESYLKKDVFNNEESDVSLTIEAGYVVDGNTLESSKSSSELTILCYNGEKPYTIVVNKAKVYSEVVSIEQYDDLVIMECGLGFINENSFMYYLNGYEITIYSNTLTIDEFENISSNISLL